MMLENWIEWALDAEQKHGQMIQIFVYILEKSGGIIWPLLFFLTFLPLDIIGKTILAVIGVMMLPVVFLYPKVFEHSIKKRREEFSRLWKEFFKFSDHFTTHRLWGNPDNKPPDLYDEVINALNRLKDGLGINLPHGPT